MDQLHEMERKTVSLTEIICAASCISILYLFGNPVISLIGGGALIGIILLSFCVGVKRLGRYGANIMEGILAITAIYGVILVLKNPGKNAVYQWMQLNVLLFVHMILSRLQMRQREYKKMLNSYSVIFWIVTVLYLILNAAGVMRASRSVISATMVKCIVPLSFFALDLKRFGFVKAMLFVVVCLILGERASAIVVMAIYAFYWILMRKKSKAMWITLFLTVLILAIAMPFVYVWMSEQSWRSALDVLSFKYTGQRFFSGRNRLWTVIINGVQDNRLTGLGFGNKLLLSYDITLSTHNVFMYLYLNGGILLVGLFVLYLNRMWTGYCRNRKSETVTKTAAYFLGMIIFMDFELFMVANNMVVSLLWWITLTVPCNVYGITKNTANR